MVRIAKTHPYTTVDFKNIVNSSVTFIYQSISIFSNTGAYGCLFMLKRDNFCNVDKQTLFTEFTEFQGSKS